MRTPGDFRPHCSRSCPPGHRDTAAGPEGQAGNVEAPVPKPGKISGAETGQAKRETQFRADENGRLPAAWLPAPPLAPACARQGIATQETERENPADARSTPHGVQGRLFRSHSRATVGLHGTLGFAASPLPPTMPTMDLGHIIGSEPLAPPTPRAD